MTMDKDWHASFGLLPNEPPSNDTLRLETTPLAGLIEIDSDNEDIIAPTRKRNRRGKHSVSADLDYNFGQSDMVPQSPKKFKFNVNHQSKGVYVGVWKHSFQPVDSEKHAVYAFIDKTDKMRARVHPETKTGEKLTDGFPVGAGQSMVSPADIIYESHLQDLNQSQRKEYVRLRAEAIERGETSADRKSSEMQAAFGARNMPETRLQNEAISNDETGAMARRTKTRVSSSNKRNKHSGILLGFWKGSDILLEADKHAAYGIAQEDDRFRVRIVRETRDGRPITESFPQGSGSVWISYDDVVLEPHLASLNRTELKEYARFLQQEDLDGLSEDQRRVVEQAALAKARAKISEDAKATGIDPVKIDAERENRRRQGNELRKARAAREERVAVIPTIDGHRRSQLTFKKRDSMLDFRRQSEHSPDIQILSRATAVETGKEKDGGRAVRLKAERQEAKQRAAALARNEYAKVNTATNGTSKSFVDRDESSRIRESLREDSRHGLQAPNSPIVSKVDGVKLCNGVRYEKRDTGPFAGLIVGDRRDLLHIDGEDFIEYRVLMRMHF